METKTEMGAARDTVEHRALSAPNLYPGFGIWVQSFIILLLYLLFYAPVFPGLVRDWHEDRTFSYGFLVPFIAGYLVWSKKSALKTTPIRPSAWGLLSLAMALLIGIVGKSVGDAFTMRVSMVAALGGAIYLVLGRDQLKALIFPLAYLLLMIPLPYAFLKPVTDHLRFSDATVSAAVLNAIGTPVFRESYFLHLPNITLEVADVCSGVSSVFALIALATVHAYFLPIPGSLKFLLIVSAVPFAIVANLFRIIITAILAYFFGLIVFQTTFHAFSGTVTFLLGLAQLVALGEAMRRKAATSSQNLVSRPKELQLTGARSGQGWVAFSAATAAFLLALYFAGSLEGRSVVPLRSELQGLPTHLGHFAASNSQWGDPYQDTKADSFISRLYEGDGKKAVELFVGYRAYQKGEDRLRSPRMFFADRWNYVWDQPARIAVPGGAEIDGKWMLTESGTTKRLVLYWYEVRGRSFSQELWYRLSQIRSSLVDGRTDGAVIRIATAVPENESIEHAKERIKEFTLNLYPELYAVLPR